MLHPKDGGPPSKRLRPDNPVRCCCPCAPCVFVFISGFDRRRRGLSKALRSVWGGGGDLRGVWGERASSSAINVMIIHESGSNTKAAVSARQAE